MTNFKEQMTLDERKAKSLKLRKKYRNRIPIIFQSTENSSVPSIDKIKYLIPSDLTIGGFLADMRRRIQLAPEEAIFLFINDKIPMQSETLDSVYSKEKDEDGFLYIYYTGENCFG